MNSICLIDVSGYIFRAFYGLPSMTRDDGTPVNAVYGFTRMLVNLISENACSHIVALFDTSRITFRQDIYPLYKKNRQETPKELIPQFPLIKEVVSLFGLKSVEKQGVEADDLIASYTKMAIDQGWNVKIISADKDLMQLMEERVEIFDPMKKKTVTLEDVYKKFGVSPDKVISVQALMGDSSDNIPGARGIGPKIASELINQFFSITNLYTHIEDVKPEKRRQILIDSRQNVLISEKLATLKNDVQDLPPLDECVLSLIDKKKVEDFFKKNNFKMTTKVLSLLEEKEGDIKENQIADSSLYKKNVSSLKKVSSYEQFKHWLEYHVRGTFYFLKTEEELFIRNNSDEIKISLEDLSVQQKDLFSLCDIIDLKKVFQDIQKVFSANNIKKVLYRAKDWYHFFDLKENPKNVIDIELLFYIKNGTTGKNDKIYLDFIEKKENYTESISLAFLEEIEAYLDCSLTQVQKELYFNLDYPLVYILYQMEKRGFSLDFNKLKNLKERFDIRIETLKEEIYKEVGSVFNLNSSQQLAKILFDDLGLIGKKKTSKGSLSTDISVLEELQDQHSVIKKVLDYRQIVKLQSTYIEPLLKERLFRERVHTTFSMTATNTGRLASSNPNLQNIPIKSLEGKEIREAFIAKEGYTLIGADYSQIELRLMAEIAQVKELKRAFAEEKDIHTLTASQIFDIPIECVTEQMRRKAKAINFGIMYGMSAFGLAKSLHISRTEAKQYIGAYFNRYPEIKDYMQRVSEQAKKDGFVTTQEGRQCFIQGFDSYMTEKAAYRAAINAPIQGSAADLIKKAMIKTVHGITSHSLEANLILQVHDELIFEVKNEDVETAMACIRQEMERGFNLDIPLLVEVKKGKNWREIH